MYYYYPAASCTRHQYQASLAAAVEGSSSCSSQHQHQAAVAAAVEDYDSGSQHQYQAAVAAAVEDSSSCYSKHQNQVSGAAAVEDYGSCSQHQHQAAVAAAVEDSTSSCCSQQRTKELNLVMLPPSSPSHSDDDGDPDEAVCPPLVFCDTVPVRLLEVRGSGRYVGGGDLETLVEEEAEVSNSNFSKDLGIRNLVKSFIF